MFRLQRLPGVTVRGLGVRDSRLLAASVRPTARRLVLGNLVIGNLVIGSLVLGSLVSGVAPASAEELPKPNAPAARTGAPGVIPPMVVTPAGSRGAGTGDTVQPLPVIAAKSWLVLDVQSHQIVASGNPEARVEPASLTKLMTAYLSFKAIRNKTINLGDTVTVSTHAWKAEGSRMFIEPERPVTVDELIHGMIIQSGNDASIALAERIGGSEDQFAQMMNREAANLGMTGTHYVNATGLPDPQHYSTAHDLSRIAAAIQRDFPEYYPLYGMKQYRYNGITQPNRNRLLFTDPSVDGMKTGHTDSAGFCLVASAKRNDRRVLSVLVGADTEAARSTESEKLLNYAFQATDTQRVYEAGTVIRRLPVFKAHSDLLDAGFREAVWLTMPKGDFARYKVNFRPRAPLIAPIPAGQSLGTLDVLVDGKVVSSLDVVALADVPMGNFLQRVWGSLRLWLH